MLGIYACDIDTIAVMGNAVDDCICQRTGITTQMVGKHSSMGTTK